VVLEVFDSGAPQSPLEALPEGPTRILVYNKSDLAPRVEAPSAALRVSAKTGEGFDLLRQAILRAAGWSSTGESVFLARERHIRALQHARGHAYAAREQSGRWEFFAEELRLAQHELGSITGEFTADDLLGEIFSRFCIGK
jgi:tRNA modification GTPase